MKPTTIEELNELRAWFNSQELPLYYENPKMQGSILLLRRIKANLEKEK